MSSPEHAEHQGRSVFFYTSIAIFLGAVTLVELGPLFELYNLPAEVLLGMSVVKFFFVVAFFMHLWDDPGILSRVFVAPLIGATLMVMVLMLLFSTYEPSPQEDSFAVQERHYQNFNGECSSWLKSSVSNTTYCASPPLDPKRVALHTKKKDGGAAAGPTVDLSTLDDAGKMAALMEQGEKVYKQNCVACHQLNGAGVPGAFPPLAASDYLGDAQKHARIIVHGLNGEIVVNGVTYNGAMAAFGALSDFDIAAVATYERNAWGNQFGLVLPADVAAVR